MERKRKIGREGGDAGEGGRKEWRERRECIVRQAP